MCLLHLHVVVTVLVGGGGNAEVGLVASPVLILLQCTAVIFFPSPLTTYIFLSFPSLLHNFPSSTFLSHIYRVSGLNTYYLFCLSQSLPHKATRAPGLGEGVGEARRASSHKPCLGGDLSVPSMYFLGWGLHGPDQGTRFEGLQ